MKRIILLCAVAFSMLATVEAQTTKKAKKGKKTSVSAESKSKAAAAKLEKERQEKFEDERMERMAYDSIRKENEKLADIRFDSERVATKDAKIKMIDSLNKESWKSHAAQQEQYAKSERNLDQVIMAANLGPNQGRQVKDINLAYNSKAKMITENATLTDDQKKEQLAALNTERRDRIKAIIGKAKEKKLERERKEVAQKNGADVEAAWIELAEGVVKS